MTTYNPRPLVARQLEFTTGTNRYLILGILDEAGYSHCCLLVQPKQMFNPQLN